MIYLLLGAATIALTLVLATASLVWLHRRRSDELRSRGQRSDAALAEIARFFEEPDQLCLKAFEATGEHGERAVADALRQARPYLERGPGRSVSESLEAIGEVERLEREARSLLPGRRLKAIAGLGECGGSRAAKILVGLLDRGDRVTRRAAREAILHAEHEPSFSAALDSYLADEPEPYGLRGAFHSVVAARAPSLLSERLVNDQLNARHSKLALEALGEVHHESTLTWARDQIAGDDPEIRASACRFVGRLRDATSVDDLLGRLDDPEWFVRCVAARSLGFFALREPALSRLSEALDDPASWVRTNVAKSLVRQGPRGASEVRRALGNGEAGFDELGGDAPAARRLRSMALEELPA